MPRKLLFLLILCVFQGKFNEYLNNPFINWFHGPFALEPSNSAAQFMTADIKETNTPPRLWQGMDLSLIEGDQVLSLLSRRLILVCLLWAAVIFAIDLSVPAGIAVAVPYFCLVLMGLWLPHPYYFTLATLGSMGLTFLGFLNSPVGGDPLVAICNRFIALMAIGITGILCHLYKREERELIAAHENLQQRVTELRNLKEKFEESSKTDHLTKLPNRRAMMEKLVYEKFLFKRNKKPFVIIMADIDFFKKINDTYGHNVGDFILIKVAQIFKKCLRKTDLICRWGGEEFLFLLPETELQGGATLAEKLRTEVENEAFSYPPYNIPVTLSFGVTIFGEETLDMDDCIRQADQNLYKAKKTGKNKVVFPETACGLSFSEAI